MRPKGFSEAVRQAVIEKLAKREAARIAKKERRGKAPAPVPEARQESPVSGRVWFKNPDVARSESPSARPLTLAERKQQEFLGVLSRLEKKQSIRREAHNLRAFNYQTRFIHLDGSVS